MLSNEQDNRRMAQGLLNGAIARQKAFEAGSTEREAAIKRTQEAFVEAITKNSVYRRTMEVMNDPLLDQLLPLFWKYWNPIELVSKGVTKETPIEVMGRVLFSVRAIKIEEEERSVPYPGPRRVLPLDPVKFMSKFPINGVDFAGRGLDPVTAYLQSIGLSTIEDEILQKLPPETRQNRYDEARTIRKLCPSYGGGSRGVIVLKSPPAPGRTSDQGKLRIETGYDLRREDFLIKLYLNQPLNVVETFATLGELQRKLAEVLVESGVTAVE